MMQIPYRAVALAALVGLSFPAPAAAQEGSGRRIRVGAGAQVVPQFPGSEDFQVQPLFSFSVARRGQTFAFEAPDESFGFNLLKREGLGIGPAVSFQNKRKNSDVGLPIGKVGFTVEAGGFVQYMFAEKFRLRAEARKGVNGHEGFIGDVSADFILRDGDAYVVSIGPRVTITDSKYQRAYFGVTPAQSAATGLPVYRPGGGVQSVGGAAGAFYELGGRVGLFGYAAYDRLIDDAADSPIVRGLGSRDQFSGGLGLTYTFGG